LWGSARHATSAGGSAPRMTRWSGTWRSRTAETYSEMVRPRRWACTMIWRLKAEEARAVQTQQFALSTDAQIRV
jgi:hypothetical protein